MAKRIKKDFDKEKMYRKIMPSAPPPTESPAAQPDSPALEVPEEAPSPQLHNFMEDMVLERMEHTLTILSGCGCDRCRKDILAIALNQLPPAYAVIKGDTAQYRRKLKGRYEVKVTAALIQAIQAVKQNPRH